MFSGRFAENKFKSGFDHRETPMDILKKRYAVGEITEAEYKDMKDKLRD